MQPAVAPVDPDRIVLRQADAAGDLGNHAARELQRGGGIHVHLRLRMKVAGGHDADRIGKRPALRGACDEARKRDRIAADVQDPPAAERPVPQAAVGVEIVVETERRLHQADPAENPGFHELDRLGRLRMAAVHERLHEEHPLRAGRFHDPQRVGAIHGQRFLAEDVLPGLRRADRPGGVERVRRRNIDRLHVAIGEQ